ncbi:UNVERIFIED_CONTAM: hypothetical protein K2H54_051421 [Gekko kuhli]
MLQGYLPMYPGIIREWEQLNLKTCDNCQEEERDRKEENFLAQITSSLLTSKEQGQVKAAFHCRTRKNISIERRSLKELNLYYIPKAGEIFHRGLGLNLTNGQYKAPLSGYYIFSATLHIGKKLSANRNHSNKSQSCTQDRLRLLICVESLCQQNISLETVSGMDKHSKLFTISVNGILFLQVPLIKLKPSHRLSLSSSITWVFRVQQHQQNYKATGFVLLLGQAFELKEESQNM